MATVDDGSANIAPIKPFGDFQSILDFVKGITGSQNSSTETGSIDPQTQALISQFLNQISTADYSKDAAIKDSQGQVAQIFDAYKQGDLPKIYSATKNSGGYDSNTGQLLADNAFGRAVAQSADVTNANVAKYATLDQNRNNQLLQLALGLGKLTQSTNKTSTTGATSSDALKKAAAAAAIAAAAKKPSGKEPNAGGATPKTSDTTSKSVEDQLKDQQAYDEPTDQSYADQLQQDIADAAGGSQSPNSISDANLPGDLSTDGLPPDIFAPVDPGSLDSLDGGGDIGNFDNVDFTDIFSGIDPNTIDNSGGDFNFPEDFGGFDLGSVSSEDL